MALCVLALGGCSDGAGPRADGGTELDGGDGGADAVWRFGGDEAGLVAVSNPAMNGKGELVVVMSEGTTASAVYSGLYVVVLSASDGSEVRRTAIAGGGQFPRRPGQLFSPVVNAKGDTWVMLLDELVRVDPSGTVSWRLSLPPELKWSQGLGANHIDYGAALGDDDAYYFTTPLELVAVTTSGVIAWRTVRGVDVGFEGANPTLYSGAPAVAGGVVYASCDHCLRAGKATLGAFSTSDGQPAWAAGDVDNVFGSSFTSPMIDAAGNVFQVVEGRLVAASSSGTVLWTTTALEIYEYTQTFVTGPNGRLVAVGRNTLIQVGAASGQLSESPIDASGIRVATRVVGSGDQDRVWVLGIGALGKGGIIAAVGTSGEVLWQCDGEPLDWSKDVLPGDGRVFGILADGSVAALAVPIKAPGAQQSWPLAGHDASWTRRGGT